MNTTKFDPLKPVRQKNGRPARYVGKLEHDNVYSFIFELQRPDGTWFHTYFTSEGKYIHTSRDTEYDLINIPEKRKLSGWLNVYEDGCAWHETKKSADRATRLTRLACIDLSIPRPTGEYEVGEGL